MATLEIKLTQNAYIDQGGAPVETYYTAHAVDASKIEEDGDAPSQGYKVRWEITLTEDEQVDCTDESNMCDWDSYTVIDLSTGCEVDAVIVV